MLKEITVFEDDDDVRIDKYLSDQLYELSRSRISSLIKDGLVLVNGKSCKASYKVAASDKIQIDIPELTEPEILAENIPLNIVYEDDDILIVNKEKGMVVHPAPGHFTGTLVNAIMYHCKDNLSGINGEKRPGIVHRIDMDTTGLLVVCKNDKAHNALSEQLKVHSITRKYHAICIGNIKEDSGTIDKPIGRSKNDRKKMCITEQNSKNAVTHYKVLKRTDKFTYIECELETGRTHQIRVHMASLGHPLIGDNVYGNVNLNKKYEKINDNYSLNGQTLHAKVLGFNHPANNQYVEYDSDLPEYFKAFLDKHFNE